MLEKDVVEEEPMLNIPQLEKRVELATRKTLALKLIAPAKLSNDDVKSFVQVDDSDDDCRMKELLFICNVAVTLNAFSSNSEML